jgi:myosin VIIa
VGCFAPSDKFQKYLRAFIRNGPQLYAPYVEERLDRTIKNGPRTQPPAYLELQTTKSKAPIYITITLMDGSTRRIEVDSATTSAEIVKDLAASIELKDSFGFSIFITLLDKVMSLGSDREHIMDAISNCEQYAAEEGVNARKAQWRLFFRKEIFAPWHNPGDDPVATNLIYQQIVKGVSYGEYLCNSEKDIAMLAACSYYANHGQQMDGRLLKEQLHLSIPKDLLRDATYQKWEKLVETAFRKSRCVRDGLPKATAKEDIVLYGKITWGMMFSRFFEAVRVDGPELPTNNVIIAVNWSGVYFVNEQEQVMLELSYAEILMVSCEQEKDSEVENLSITTVQKEDYTFRSFDAKPIEKLVNYLLEELKKRSIFAVALQNYKNPNADDSYLSLAKGDLIVLGQGFSGETLLADETSWGYGESNGLAGYFPVETVYILPCVLPPTTTVLNLFKVSQRVLSSHRIS